MRHTRLREMIALLYVLMSDRFGTCTGWRDMDLQGDIRANVDQRQNDDQYSSQQDSVARNFESRINLGNPLRERKTLITSELLHHVSEV